MGAYIMKWDLQYTLWIKITDKRRNKQNRNMSFNLSNILSNTAHLDP